MSLWPIVIIGAIIWTIGDIFIKYWVEGSKSWHWVIGILIWTVGLMFLAQSFHYKNMAVAGILMVTLNSIFLVIISWVLFKESLSFVQIGGIGICLVGLYLLEIG